MARFLDKQKAVKLRLQGKSYNQIKADLGISKSTLSGWLKEMPLNSEQFLKLNILERRVETYRKTCKIRKEKILKKYYDEEKKILFPMSKRDLYVAGLFLYWGEGGKTQDTMLTFSNTNPAMIKFFIFWLENSLKVNKNKIKIRLHLYKDMNIENEFIFWSNKLDIGREQFRNPYIKNSNKCDITYKVGFGHGTCNVILSNAILSRRVLAGLRIFEDYFSKK